MSTRKAPDGGVNSPLSQIKKKLKHFKLAGYDMTVEEMLLFASEKLSPIVEMLVDASGSTEHFITLNECDDIEETSYIVADVARTLETIGLQTSTKSLNLNLDKYRASSNINGCIYVDTILLLEILEIYNILESIQCDIDAFYKSIGIHSFVQTDDVLSFSSIDSINPNKIVFKLNKNISSTALFNNEYIVMSSTSEIRTQASAANSSVRKTKSANSLEEIREVTDVYGARRVLVKCIFDLQGVSDYLGIARKDVSTICSRVEVDNIPQQQNNAPRRSSVKQNNQHQDVQQGASSENKCCCPECFGQAQGSQLNLGECDDDQVIICIKGCNEDEGDVQIVIRQCPDCKKAEDRAADKPPSDYKKEPILPIVQELSSSQSKPIPSQSKPIPSQSKSTPSQSKPIPVESTPIIPWKRASSLDVGEKESYPENVVKNIESTTLHNKDSKGSLICSDEEGEEKRTSVPENVESAFIQQRASCSRIKLFETTNLCLQTDTGKELVISLTVTPKDLANAPKKLSITDIFSDNDYIQRTSTDESEPVNTKKASFSSKQSGSSSRRSSRGSPRRSGGSKSGKANESYYVADKYIPLGRTKICSSLDFDVTTEDSKIRNKGIQNKNNKIVVQLNDFGTDNLLRACRPAKCCRKAILNEKMKKCLPYAPSLRSLPLDDEDMQVINQSLQMSLQKVKNSTNIAKDFYSNYFLNPIRTVMYFLIEEDLPKEDLEDICRQSFLKQKLGYYINLVKDVQSDFASQYDILYFGVDAKLDKNQNNQSVKICSIGSEGDERNEIADVGITEVISSPIKWMRQKYNKYDERPAISSNRALNRENESFLMRNYKNSLSKSAKQPSQIRHKKPLASKIPVYSGYKAANLEKIDHEIIETELYQISLMSLPRKHGELLMEAEIRTNQNKPIIPKEKIDIKTKDAVIQSFENCSDRSKSKTSSKYSMATNARRHKRKKKEFYLSRSRSEISLNTLKHVCKTKNLRPPLRKALDSSKQTSQTTSQASNPLSQQDSSKIVLEYFTKILYEMIMKQMSKDQETKLNTSNLTSVSVGTDDFNLQELFRKPPKQHIARHISNLDVEISYHALKAKHSQYCMVQASRANSSHLCVYHNLALQTSKIFGDSKKCQTSNTLLAYILNSNGQSFRKKRIFKKTYNSEGNSCNEIENFIVTFRSDQSFNSNFSEGDFMSSNSCSNPQLVESDQEDSLSQSLIRLKETLEKYENVKSKIASRSLRESNIDPIEYFVYQMCACNKFNKKPSVMQKILSKTKGLFSAVEKDICKKYKNQREFFSMSSTDKADLCHKCGCYISKCGEATTPAKQPTTTAPLLCQCPQDHKANNNKKVKPIYCNLSKLASASSSSLKSLKARLKKSVSNVMGPNKASCSCPGKTTGKKNADSVCVPPNVSVIKCDKKNTSTGTTKDSSTQKCECAKCQSYSEDGTCCCSHCLGCLDKSFAAKPDNNSVGVVTDEKTSTAAAADATSETADNKSDAKSNNNSVGIVTDEKSNAVVDEASGTVDNSDASAPSKPNDEANVAQITPANNEDVANAPDIETIDTSKGEADTSNGNDTTAYFFMAPPPRMFEQFRYGSGNPFEQYLLSFPQFTNMFHVEDPNGVLDE